MFFQTSAFHVNNRPLVSSGKLLSRCSATYSQNGRDNFAEAESTEKALQLKQHAIDLLECLTSPKSINEAGYDPEKDRRRTNLLLTNSYESLKIALRRKGLSTHGDKLEMISRLLLSVIDPDIDFNEM